MYLRPSSLSNPLPMSCMVAQMTRGCVYTVKPLRPQRASRYRRSMAKSVKDLVAAANAVVPRISADEAKQKMAAGALVVDVRDAAEVEQSGKVAGAVHIPRGMLEFRADPDSPVLRRRVSRRTSRSSCTARSGGRAALSGQALKEMGYEEVYNLGGFGDWAKSGGAVEKP